MNSERLEGLLWELIDGEISSEDRLLLQEYLVGRAEAEDTRREFFTLATRLDSIEKIDPPSALRRSIDTALDELPLPGSEALPEPIRMPPPTTPIWRMRASYLAAGLLIGGGLTFLFFDASGVELDRSKLYGSVQYQVAPGEEKVFELESGAGSLTLGRSGSRRSLDLDLTREGPFIVELESGSGMVRLESLSQARGAGLEAVVEGSRLRLTADGPAAFGLTTDVGENEASVLVTVTAEDTVLGVVELLAGEFPNAR